MMRFLTQYMSNTGLHGFGKRVRIICKLFLPPPLEPENDNLPDRHRRQKEKRKRT